MFWVSAWSEHSGFDRPEISEFYPLKSRKMSNLWVSSIVFVLDYLKRSERHRPVALGTVSQMRRFAQSVGRHFIKGLALGGALCPEPG